MLPTWIIDELERDRRERERDQRRELHIEAPAYSPPQPSDEPEQRGGTVVVIDIL